MAGRPTPFSRLAWQIGPTALEGFENEGLIRFDDPAQRSRLVVRWRAEKPMPPAERRRWMDAAEFRGLRQTHALDHRLGVIQPLLLLAQMRHRRLVRALNVRRQALQRYRKSPSNTPADDLALAQCDSPDARPARRRLPSASSRRLPVVFIPRRIAAAFLTPSTPRPFAALIPKSQQPTKNPQTSSITPRSKPV